MFDRAAALDAQDPLAGLRQLFVIPDDDQVYLDGNSLGRPPREALAAISAAAEQEWAEGLVGSWHDWVGLPRRLGSTIARIVGAEEDSVIVADQTSLNLYKLAAAAMQAAGGGDIVTSIANFPSDIYVLEGVAGMRGGSVRFAEGGADGLISPEQLQAAITPSTRLVSFSHVDFKTGALRDIAALTDAAHDAGAMVLWDLSHSVGVVPVDLAGIGADLAVGCTYKYLNGGPGAPAFLYVAPRHQTRLTQPIRGWFSHANMFAFETDYVPAPGIERFAVGTPPILSMRAAEAGLGMVVEAGVPEIRAKSLALTGFLLDLAGQHLAGFGLEVATPLSDGSRGGHVSLRHPDAYRISAALLARRVVGDFREPDILRLAPSPLYTRFSDVAAGVERLVAVMESKEYESFDRARRAIT